MVKSIINSSVEYNVTHDIDPADVGYESSIYPYTLFGEEIEMALGKPKYEFSSKYGIVYFPLYLVIEDEPVSCMGIYEIENNDVLHSFKEDEEDEEMELKSNHILISMTKPYFFRILKKIKDQKPISEKEKEKKNIPLEAPEYDEKEEEENEDEMHLKLPQNIKEKETDEKKKIKAPPKSDSLFESENNVSKELLPEESQEDAALLKRNYKESTQNQWIEKFMKNNEYHLIDNEGGGDCFFAVLRDAFESIGKKTTVQKLRALLSEEATPQLFEESRSLYMSFLGELQAKEKEIKDIKQTIRKLKERSTKSSSPSENAAILTEAKKLVEKNKDASHEKQETQKLLKEFSYMENIDTFEKYKEFIQTSQYWADTWAISTLEKLLKIKVVVLSEESFTSGDIDSVLQCCQLNDEDVQKAGYFRPDYYILTSYTGQHYTLVTYKDRRIFTFQEVPYDIKILVINKCMERNSGPYHMIHDFRTLKTKFGLEANHGEITEEDEDKEADRMKQDVYESDIVFMFHSLSDGTPKAGKGSGEKIPNSRLLEFTALNKIKGWRKQLDDSWISAFMIDGKRWSSVEHYFLGSQYKKSFPDFFAQFSLDSKSEMAADVAMARAAVSKSGKYKDKVLRDRKVKPDPDFFEIKTEPRYMQERRIALYAKFSQNLDLKHTLLETQRAKLIHFVRGGEPEVDLQLMQLRKDFQKEENK